MRLRKEDETKYRPKAERDTSTAHEHRQHPLRRPLSEEVLADSDERRRQGSVGGLRSSLGLDVGCQEVLDREIDGNHAGKGESPATGMAHGF